MERIDREPPGTDSRRLRVLAVSACADESRAVSAALAARGLLIDYARVECELDMAAQLAAGEWDLVLYDHARPGFDPLAVLAVLGRSGRDLPFIVHSDRVSVHAAVAGMYEGVADVVAKTDYARLVAVIERERRAAATRRALVDSERRIRELAHFDDLSALPNHRLFCRKVSDRLEQAGRRTRGLSGALLVLDVDRFMRINTSFGYEAGSAVLREVARRLSAALGHDVVLARLGGDVFGVFVAGSDDAALASMLARRVLAVFEAPFMKDGIELFLTASVGIARAPRDGHTVHELLMNAEIALAVAKRGGGNGTSFYERAMNAASAERMALESDLRHAIERGELFLQYQPVVDVRRGVAIGAEALLRWRHAREGVIAPDRFIPLADETGLITDIGAWVLREACLQGARWHRMGWRDFRISVNVSAVQFGEPRLLEAVSEALRESGFPPGCLTLEITETSIMSDVESAAGMLRALRNMSVRVAVDDFGTGYSSFAYLKRLPIDVIKIDKSFVRDVCRDEEDAAIVRAIIVLARSLRLKTVAEGVEDAAQESLLRESGCDYLQGFRFGRPVAGQALARGGIRGPTDGSDARDPIAAQ